MKKSVIIIAGLGIAATILLGSCVSIPDGAVAVQPFDQKKYLGRWYEIARMDFKYEKDLSNVTATYSLNTDNSIKVDNRGYNEKKQVWKQSIGKAKSVQQKDLGRLKVSFFGPFYSGYNVIAIDPDYQYALVVGDNLKYMWILSRQKTIPEKVKQEYLLKAKELGYDTDQLVWTKHNDQQ